MQRNKQNLAVIISFKIKSFFFSFSFLSFPFVGSESDRGNCDDFNVYKLFDDKLSFHASSKVTMYVCIVLVCRVVLYCTYNNTPLAQK